MQSRPLQLIPITPQSIRLFSVTCAIVSTCNGVQIGNERWKNPCGTQFELISNIISNIGNGIQLVNQTIQKYVSSNMLIM